MGFLHQAQVSQHQVFSHHTGLVGVVLMAVDTTYLDGLTIDKQLSATNVYLAETHLLGDALDGLPFGVFQLHQQGIETGLFSTPQARADDLYLHAVELAVATLGVPFVHAGGLVLEVKDFGNSN